ncbi:hypothetical protein LINPERHAP2_LOCUS25493, partial [Linum perenne]
MAEGVLIQGDPHRNFASALQKRVTIGSVYAIPTSRFVQLVSVTAPVCGFSHCLDLTASTKFELQECPDIAFVY